MCGLVEKLRSCLKDSSRFCNLHHYKANLPLFVFVLVYVVLQIILVILQVNAYKGNNEAVLVARSCGILLSFNMSLIVLLILRRSHTSLRRVEFVNKWLPIDDFLALHKFIGVFITALSLVHATGHTMNLYLKSTEYNDRLGFQNDTEYAPLYELLFTRKANVGWFYQISCPSGWAILVMMIVIQLLSTPFVRRKCFELFVYSHRLHVIVYALTIVHCSNFWKWFVTPLVFVLLEMFHAYYYVHSDNFGSTYIKDVKLLPSDVVQLVIMRPEKFNFKAGDYIRIKIPALSRIEYHPFTISSSPEDKDELWLHIRVNGDWTNRLLAYFKTLSARGNNNQIFKQSRFCCCYKRLSSSDEFCDVSSSEPLPSKMTIKSSFVVDERPNQKRRGSSIPASQRRFTIVPGMELQAVCEANLLAQCTLDAGFRPKTPAPVKIQYIRKKTNLPALSTSTVVYSLFESNEISNVFLDVNIDGPFSTASRKAFNTEHAILVGSNIGITPFASILQSVWARHSNAKSSCPNCNYEQIHAAGTKNLKKVDFIWINRNYESFEWFMDLLAELELQQELLKERFLDIHLFSTCKDLENSEAIKMFTAMTKKIENAEVREQVEQMLRKIQRGRPKFDKVLQSIVQKSNRENIEVYFCGSPQLGKALKSECLKQKLKYSQENF